MFETEMNIDPLYDVNEAGRRRRSPPSRITLDSFDNTLVVRNLCMAFAATSYGVRPTVLDTRLW